MKETDFIFSIDQRFVSPIKGKFAGFWFCRNCLNHVPANALHLHGCSPRLLVYTLP